MVGLCGSELIKPLARPLLDDEVKVKKETIETDAILRTNLATEKVYFQFSQTATEESSLLAFWSSL